MFTITARATVASAVCFAAAGFGAPSAQADPTPAAALAIPVEDMQAATGVTFVARFELPADADSTLPRQDWYISNFKNKRRSFYNVDWSDRQVAVEQGQVNLKLTKRGGVERHETSGELIRKGKYGYGRYEVIMKPATGSGLVSSFFTHTGPYFGDPHDEIDIEFLGADTTNIHFNHFRDGKRVKPTIVPLGFDASAAFHTYAFEWYPDRIEWFVDGHLAHVQTESIPRTPGRILINLWTGKPGLYRWHGAPDFAQEVAAEYRCLSYRPLYSDAQTCSYP